MAKENVVYLKSFMYIPENLFDYKLAKQLTIENPEYRKLKRLGVNFDDVEPYFELFKKVDLRGHCYYQVPRYALGNFNNNFKYTVKENFGVCPIDIFLRSKIINDDGSLFELNEQQKTSIDSMVSTLRKELGCVFVAKTGEGKTASAIHVIKELKQKTLILVHKNYLADQWKSSLKKYLDLKDSDIGLLKQGKFVDGKVVIGLMQSLMRGTIPNEINTKFGLVITDELHVIGGKVFLKSATRFNSKYRLGLSATPFREDGLHVIYFNHVSNNIVQHENVRNVKSDYFVYEYEREQKWKWYPPFIPMKIQLINNIVEDDVRSGILVHDLIIPLYKSGRKIIVLSERIAHLKTLMSSLISELPKAKIVRFFGAETLTKKQKLQGMKTEVVRDPIKKELDNADIVMASFGKVKEGVDIPHLDTLVYATPTSSDITIVQSKGRIERMYEGKQAPLIIDIYDLGKPLLIGMWKKRERIYLDDDMRRIKTIKGISNTNTIGFD